MSASVPSRRTLLTGAGVVVGGVAGSSLLAACGGGSSSSSNTSGSSSTPHSLAALTSIPDGTTVAVHNPKGGTVLLHRAGDTVTGLSAKCTHQGCTVAVQGNSLDCPCHGSKFDAATGAVLNGPASEPLPPVAVTVTGGQVMLA